MKIMKPNSTIPILEILLKLVATSEIFQRSCKKKLRGGLKTVLLKTIFTHVAHKTWKL